MSGENYYNYYVEILTQTLNQQVLANISTQAKAKVNDDVLSGFQKENDSLKKKIEELKTELENSQSIKDQQKSAEIERLKTIIGNKEDNIKSLQSENSRLNSLSVEFEKVKHQVAHIDTFRNQLIKVQETIVEKDSLIENLNEQIEYLKLTPAKRKKLDEKNNPQTVEETITPENQTSVVDFIDELPTNTIRDGGSF